MRYFLKMLFVYLSNLYLVVCINLPLISLQIGILKCLPKRQVIIINCNLFISHQGYHDIS